MSLKNSKDLGRIAMLVFIGGVLAVLLSGWAYRRFEGSSEGVRRRAHEERLQGFKEKESQRVRENRDELLGTAQAALEEGHYRKARVFFGQLKEVFPDDAEIGRGYATSMERESEWVAEKREREKAYQSANRYADWETFDRDISIALKRGGARGCGQYRFRWTDRSMGEAKVHCTADGKKWVEYLVWTNLKKAEGPFRITP